MHRRTAGLIILVILLVAGHALAQGRLSHDIEPVRQAIHLTLDPRLDSYTGSVSIDLAAHRAAGEFRLHAEGLTINHLTLTSSDGASLATDHIVNEYNELVITIPDGMAAGDYRLDIDFENVYDTQAVSLYKVVYENESYLFTQMEADEAREAFPCFDEPSFKIPFDLMFTVPTAHHVVSNTPVKNTAVEDDLKTVTFQRTKPLPVYLVAICVGPFDTVDMPDLPIPARIYVPKGKQHLTDLAVEMTPPILEELQDYFDSPYPYEKLDYIAVPEFWPGAMENAGAITFAEGVLLQDASTSSLSQRRYLAIVIAHEIAHQWFGNLVTMEWWDDLWLNEAFATWMGNKIAHRIYPEFDIPVTAVRTANAVLDSDARPSSKAIRQPVVETAELLSNIGAVYYKGQAVLNMFESWMGEEIFRDGVLRYLNGNRWGNATADDLWRALEVASGRDIPSAMKTFIDQPGAPLVIIERDGDRRFRFVQQRMANYGIELEARDPWFIPMHLRYSCGNAIHDTVLVLRDSMQIVELRGDGPVEWIMPQADGVGYYRWSLPPRMMVAMAERAVADLAPVERVVFLGNLSALLDAGAIDGRGYLEALHGLADDPHPQVLVTLSGNVSSVGDAFRTDDNAAAYAEYVRETLRPALEHIGMTPRPDEDETVAAARPTLIGMLAIEGKDTTLLSWAEEQFEHYLEDPSSVDRSLAGIIVGLGCIRGDRELFDEVRRRFESADNPTERGRFLNALSAFRDFDLQEAALEYCLVGPLRPQEIFSIPRLIASHSAADADSVLQWLFDNYDAYMQRIPPVFAMYLPTFGAGCSEERLTRAVAFFTADERIVQGMDAMVARVRDQVTDCVSLRERELASVDAFLNQFSSAAE